MYTTEALFFFALNLSASGRILVGLLFSNEEQKKGHARDVTDTSAIHADLVHDITDTDSNTFAIHAGHVHDVTDTDSDTSAIHAGHVHGVTDIDTQTQNGCVHVIATFKR